MVMWDLASRPRQPKKRLGSNWLEINAVQATQAAADMLKKVSVS